MKTKESIILDHQFDDLSKNIMFCSNCVVSNQRPRTIFNEQGVCSACQWAFEKDNVIDWKKREQELQILCDKYRSKDGSYDVVVPGSGGKDSGYVAHQLKYRYNMHPLCVTWAPFEYTDIGWQNLQTFIATGFDNMLCQPNGIIHRKLAKISFELLGDAWEPFAYGQKSFAFHMALRFGVKLIFYGENGELEYGGSDKYKHMPKETPEEWKKNYYKGTSIYQLVKYGIEKDIYKPNEINDKTFQLYVPPHPDEIKKAGIEMHWYSYYHKWIPEENYYYSFKHTGFRPNPEGRSEGTYTKYASLDDKADGFHFYLSYMKFGLGRATRDAMQDIRCNHITRNEGIALVNRFDGEFPKKHYKWFLDYLDIREEFFWYVMDLYREKSNVWKKENGKWHLLYRVS